MVTPTIDTNFKMTFDQHKYTRVFIVQVKLKGDGLGAVSIKN